MAATEIKSRAQMPPVACVFVPEDPAVRKHPSTSIRCICTDFAARYSVEELQNAPSSRNRVCSSRRGAREKVGHAGRQATDRRTCTQYVFASTSFVHRLESKRSLNASKQPTNSFSSASCRSSTLPDGGSVPVRSAHASRKASTRAVPSAMSCGGNAAATAPSASASADSAVVRQARRD